MEIKVTFADVPGAAIVGDENAVMELITKLAAGMDAAQLDRMLLKAECRENTGSLAGDPAWNVDAIVDALNRQMEKRAEQMANETPLTDEELRELWQYISGWPSWEVMKACAGNVSARQLLEQMRKASSHHKERAIRPAHCEQASS